MLLELGTYTHAPTITCINVWPGLQGSGGEDEGHDGGQGGEQQVLPLRALQMRRRKGDSSPAGRRLLLHRVLQYL